MDDSSRIATVALEFYNKCMPAFPLSSHYIASWTLTAFCFIFVTLYQVI